MMPISNLNIAVIGDTDLVNGLRLAGIKRYFIIEDNQDAREEVRQALTELINEPDVGLIAIREDYVQYVEDLIAQVKEAKKLTPVFVEVPSKYGTKYQNIAEYYKAYVRKFTGFDVEI